MKILTYQEWEEFRAQVLPTYSQAPTDFMQAERTKLIFLLNRLGYEPATEHDALLLAEELLEIGWA